MRYWKTNSSTILADPASPVPTFKAVQEFAGRWLGGQAVFEIQTSGSTGVPKVIALQRDQMIASAQMTGRVLELPSGTSALVCLNPEYIAGMMMIVRGLVLGWDLIIVEPSANPLLSIDAGLEIDFVAMVPLQLSTLLSDPASKQRLNTIGKVLLGGAPISSALMQKIKLLKVPVYQSYGMTETVSHIALRRLNGGEMQEDYRVLDGMQFGTDARGCLFVKGAVTHFDTVQTNDLVEITSNDTFEWKGRIDSVINSGGVKIYLDKIDATVDGILNEMQVQTRHFCWFENDELLGQKLILFLEDTTLDHEELLIRIAQLLKPYEVPKAIYSRPQFRTTSTGKIDKIATSQKDY